MSVPLQTADFDYRLPGHLIAQVPALERDRSRLLVLDRRTGTVRHRVFRDLVDLLAPGDLLVVNQARVVPARLFGRSAQGDRVEVFLTRAMGPGCWAALISPSRRARVGDHFILAGGAIEARVLERAADGQHQLHLSHEGTLRDLLWQFGRMPLPPYIRRARSGGVAEGSERSRAASRGAADPCSALEALDRARYQTVYARDDGAIAAPTAGLHFTTELIARLQERGIRLAALTLHVGLGTFRPVRVPRVDAHRMEPERYVIPEETALAIKSARQEGRRVVAVGTTTVRALEHAMTEGGIRAGPGVADLFISPGHRFMVIDALVTNFHLPRSTLLMLVSAFAGREAILSAYREAIAREYRFYSYGDAMLIL
jgi:S-adenosylmethionine:tRNA ribosyltransferase-isomerase